jgi:hypothetical protein
VMRREQNSFAVQVGQRYVGRESLFRVHKDMARPRP